MQACISKGESCMEYEKVLEKELREEFQNPPVQMCIRDRGVLLLMPFLNALKGK